MTTYPQQEPTLRQPIATLRMEGKLSSGTGIVLPMHQFIQGVSTEWGLDSAFQVTFNLFDPWFDYVESFIHDNGHGVVGYYSFGWQGQDGIVSQEFTGFLKTYTSRITPGGANLQLIFQPVYAAIGQARPIPGIKFGRREVSDAVDYACEILGIPAENRFIEPTAGEFDIPDLVGVEGVTFSRWLEIVKRMARPKRSVISYGAYVYRFDPDGIFRFSTQGVDAQFRMRLYDTYVYGFANDGRVFNMEIVDNRPTLLYLGSERSVARVADTDNPEDTVEEHDLNEGAEEAVTEEGGVQPGVEDQNLPAAYAAMPISEFLSEEEEARLRIRQRWLLYSGLNFHVNLEILGDPHVTVGDFIYVRVVKRDGTPHFMSGYYSVKRVAHELDASKFTTSIVAIRRASSLGDIVSGAVEVPVRLGPNNQLLGDRVGQSIRVNEDYRFVLGDAYFDDQGRPAIRETDNIELSRRISTRIPGYTEPPPDFHVPRPFTPTPMTNQEAEPEEE